MSNAEIPQVEERVSATYPRPPDYRTVAEAPAGRFLMPARATVIVEFAGRPDGLERLTFDVELVDDRRYLVSAMSVRPAATVGELGLQLRAPNFARWARLGLEHLSKMETVSGGTFTAESPMTNPDPLWAVALTYSTALLFGEPPTNAVAEDMGLTAGAAAQRVKRARDAGYLPPATPGKAS